MGGGGGVDEAAAAAADGERARKARETVEKGDKRAGQ
jgi:hypothetical protein